jgi:AcrR family transcriptional regulator
LESLLNLADAKQDIILVTKDSSKAITKSGNLGRPEGITRNREEILDAAEACFAEAGYAGTSLRTITMATGVTQAMITYYFGSKRELFRQVYLRRGQELKRERMESLSDVLSRPTFSVRDVLRAYLNPTFKLLSTQQGKYFLRLQARIHTEPDELAYELRREVYDLPVRSYVSALSSLLPRLSEKIIYIRFTQMIGIYLYILSGAHRLDQISEGKYDIPDPAEMIEEIVEFAAKAMSE